MSCAVPPARSEANAMMRSLSSVAGPRSSPSLLSSATSVGVDHGLVRLRRVETHRLWPLFFADLVLLNQMVRPSRETDGVSSTSGELSSGTRTGVPQRLARAGRIDRHRSESPPRVEV